MLAPLFALKKASCRVVLWRACETNLELNERSLVSECMFCMCAGLAHVCAHALQAGHLEIQICWLHICGEGITVVICMHCCFPAAERLNTRLQASIHCLAHGCVEPIRPCRKPWQQQCWAMYNTCLTSELVCEWEMMAHCACVPKSKDAVTLQSQWRVSKAFYIVRRAYLTSYTHASFLCAVSCISHSRIHYLSKRMPIHIRLQGTEDGNV